MEVSELFLFCDVALGMTLSYSDESAPAPMLPSQGGMEDLGWGEILVLGTLFMGVVYVALQLLTKFR
jgi:hypothetical protein